MKSSAVIKWECDVVRETDRLIELGIPPWVAVERIRNVSTQHTEACWAMPECLTCGRRKKPYGRDAGVVAANGYCDNDCPGYREGPRSGHFWPGESAEKETA